MLYQAYISQGRAIIADKEMEGLAKAKLNGRQVKLCYLSGDFFPLINCFLDQERSCHCSRSSYQEKYSYSIFPSRAGGQGERELHPRIQRHEYR